MRCLEGQSSASVDLSEADRYAEESPMLDIVVRQDALLNMQASCST